MIRSFTDRRPGVSALLIGVFLFLLPGALMFVDDMFLTGTLHIASIFFYFTLAVQLVMMLTVERPVLIAEPFIIGLLGLCVGEVLFAVSRSAAVPGAGPSLWVYLTSSYLIAICGGNAAAGVGALILFFFIFIGRKICEHFRYR